ncbi:MAG: PAS domain S-box protein [Scytolyngbya sp. HA4215-MV1]|jgi:PAS domain S-box-containing protein|nr:PAS domain S-box protein [Scytolyngbya sp. HA4215-MV1]
MNRIARTLLIVDDSPEDREIYQRYLLRDQACSYTILEAELGQQGLDLWHQHQPDAVLVDYRLPDMDGLEFLSHLQPTTPERCLPVILMTGQGNETIAVQAMKAGAQDYLVKGQITPEGLYLAINGTIETVQLRIQLQQRIERERLSSKIIQKIQQMLELEDILQTAVDEVRQFLHTDRVLFFRLEPDGNGTVVAESVGAGWRSLRSSRIYDPCLAKNYLRFSRSQSVTYDHAFVEDYFKRYRQGQVTAIADIQNSEIDRCHIDLLTQFQVRANLVVPILHGNQFWGLLIAHHCTAPRSWQPLEIDLLQELVPPVSIALRQAELYQQAQRELIERQQVEVELRESEERLRVALEASRMGLWDWNIQTGHISWSKNLEALFGLESGEFDGSFEMFANRLHPDDRERVLAAVDDAVTTGADYVIEFRIVYPDGTIRWALTQGKVFYDLDGRPIRMAGIDIDITDRKQSEAALRDSEERFRQLAENIDVVFWIKDTFEDRVSYISPAYERLWGWNPQELYENQQAWGEHIHPDDRAWSAKAFQEKAAAGQFDEEYRIILADGRVRWIRDRCFPLRDQAGILYRFAGIAEDITDRKQSEAALRDSEERFRTSVENMLDCFGIYRAIRDERGQIIDFRIEYVNNAACIANQMQREQQIGRGLCEILPGHRDSGLFDEYCQVIETGQALVKDSLVYEDEYGQQRLTRAFDIRIAKWGDGFVATWRDITDRKQTEVELQKSQAQLQQQLAEIEAIYQNAPIGLSILDTDLRFIRINQRLAEINGYSVEAHLGCTVRELLPNIADSAEQILYSILETGEPRLNVEIRGETPAQQGMQRIWLESFLPLKHNDRVIGISIVCEEITERIQVETALRQSEAQFREMADNAPMMIWVTDATGYCTYLSKNWYDFTGQTEATGLGFGWLDAIHVEEYELSKDIFLRASARHEVFRLEYRLRRQDGVYRWVINAANPWFGAAGEFKGYIGSVIDISDRKQVEEALMRSEERYRTLFESMEDGFCVVELVFDENNTAIDYHFLEINPAFEQQTGLKQAEGKTARQLLPNLEEHWFETYGKVALTGEPIRFENRSSALNRWFDVYAFRIGQPEQRKVAILFKDISHQKAITEQREQLLQQEQSARAEAERANRIKDEFLAVLSHELRSPLNPILGWTKLLQSRKFDQTKTKEALATIERNAKLQTQLIDDLLDVAKILRGKLSMDTAPVDPVFVIESAIDTVRTAAIAKSIRLHPVLSQIGRVSGDSTRLQQVVWNLLSNAIKFTPPGGQVTIWLERVDHQAQITVSDTGKGINPDFLPHLFESFRQEDASTTRQFGGLGLGLAIVRSLVEAHGGSISAQSSGEGQGATFIVKLPLLDTVLEHPQSDTSPVSDLDLTGMRVLAVDDEPDARELLIVLLTLYGAEVLAVTSAAEVLANLESFHPDILVSDIGMPEIDGYTLIQRIRALPPDQGGKIPAIALTAYAREEDHQKAINSGYQQHVTKPLDPDQLVQALITLVRNPSLIPFSSLGLS